jgi:hypothetical protein
MHSALISPRVLSMGAVQGDKIYLPFYSILGNRTNLYVDADGFIFSEYKKAASVCDRAKTILKLLSAEEGELFIKVSAKLILSDLIASEISILKEIFQDKYLITDYERHYFQYAAAIQKYGISVVDSRRFATMYHAKLKITNDELSDKILCSLKNMVQRKSAFRIENLHNDILVEALRTHGNYCDFTVADQARSGESSNGGVGSLDIFVLNKAQDPFSIIECLCADSFGAKDKNVPTHFNKLLNSYDKIGLSRNYLITYCSSVDFHGAFQSYFSILESINTNPEFSTKYKVNKIATNVTGAANIKLVITTHEREGSFVEVYHYFADFSLSDKTKAISDKKLVPKVKSKPPKGGRASG